MEGMVGFRDDGFREFFGGGDDPRILVILHAQLVPIALGKLLRP